MTTSWKTGGFAVERLLTPQAALETFFARVRLASPRRERVALAAAGGRVLAADAVAGEDHPTHPRSTMDGFALRSADGAARLRVSGAVAMGMPPAHAVAPGEAVRVPTGGAIPDGADAVVPQEDVTFDGDAIVVATPLAPGDNVTPRADDIARGETVLRAGRRLGGPELGVLATLGIAHVDVYAKPRIAIVSTGDELIDPDAPLALGTIRDSNRYALAAALAALGAEPVHAGRARDDRDDVRAVLAASLASGCDAIVTTGGSSVGNGDLVPEIVAELGAPGAVVHGIRVKPGKPTLLGAVGTTPVLGLPGNPASALTILEAVARPIVVALTGETGSRAVALEATVEEDFNGRPGWTWYVPARLRYRDGRLYAAPLRIRSSHTSLLARANGYATLGEERPHAGAGERISVALFSGGGAPIEGT